MRLHPPAAGLVATLLTAEGLVGVEACAEVAGQIYDLDRDGLAQVAYELARLVASMLMVSTGDDAFVALEALHRFADRDERA